MIKTHYTATQAAEILGVGYSTVKLHLKKIGAKKHGRDWIVSEKILLQLEQSIQKEKGRKFHN